VRTVWYAAVALVPESERGWLAEKLSASLGRGDEDTKRSLSRALVALGEEVIEAMERTRFRRTKEALTICRRDVRKLISAAMEEGASGNWRRSMSISLRASGAIRRGLRSSWHSTKCSCFGKRPSFAEWARSTLTI